MDFLCGRNSYLSDVVGVYQREYLELDIEFTSRTLEPSFRFICSDALSHKPINNGHVVAVLSFADMIHRRYSHISWYRMQLLVQPLACALEDIGFNPEQLKPSYSNIL